MSHSYKTEHDEKVKRKDATNNLYYTMYKEREIKEENKLNLFISRVKTPLNVAL